MFDLELVEIVYPGTLVLLFIMKLAIMIMKFGNKSKVMPTDEETFAILKKLELLGSKLEPGVYMLVDSSRTLEST